MMAPRSLVDDGDSWSFGAVGDELVSVEVGQTLLLRFTGMQVRLTGHLTLIDSGGATVELDPWNPKTVGPTLDLLGDTLVDAVARKDGRLALRFATGAQVSAVSRDGFEAWEVTTEDFYLVGDSDGVHVGTETPGPAITTVVLSTPDRKALRRFYELLGFQFRVVARSREVAFYVSSGGHPTVEIVASDPGTSAIAPLSVGTVRVEVGGLAETHARLIEAGAIVTPALFDNRSSVVARDPDGRCVEISEPQH